MSDQKDALLTALLTKVEKVLNGSDETVPKSKDNYIAWCKPGIPFQAEDLQFAVKGITGKDGDETRDLVRNAAEFSRLVNSIPSSNVLENGIFEQNNKRTWNVYNDVLKLSQVANSEPTDSEKQKIAKFRSLFVVTKKTKDIITDEETEVVEDSPMIKAYKQKQAEYNDAVLAYNTVRLAALNSEDKESVQNFALNANVYRSKVRTALDSWSTNGHKEDVEKINAYIRQLSQRSLSLLKEDLIDKFDKAKMSDPNSGSDFYLSSFYPGNFVNNDNGWTKITFSAKSKETYSKDTSSATSASFGANYGLWSASGEGGSTKDTSYGTMNSDNFHIEFSIAQVTIGRPWMSPEFLTNTAWRWKDGLGESLLSDGNLASPKGQMISYPTTAIFVKDIKIRSKSMETMRDNIKKSTHGSASVGGGWGPFSFNAKASHKNSSTEDKTSFDEKTGTLTVKGMQIIAFKCFALPLSPNPSKEITDWI